MRARFLGPCVALALLVGAVGTSAQSANSKPSQSIAALKKQAANGDAKAQFKLGMDYDNGQGVPKDHAEATRWFRKAAEQGNATAQFNLGVAYEAGGQGVPQDYAEAVKASRHNKLT